MARDFSSDELAERTFVITMVGVGTFIAVVFLFIIL
jgi:hypothetical protein